MSQRPHRRSREPGSFGPGWLFVIAGAAACAAGVLVPAAHDLREVRLNEARLQAALDHMERRVEAYLSFIDQVEARDPVLLRRLAATQLNLAPAGERLILDGGARLARVNEWIESAAGTQSGPEVTASAARPLTMLERVALGPQRLWFLAAGVLCLFIGLVIDFRVRPAPRAIALREEEPAAAVVLGHRPRRGRRGALAALLTPVTAT
jgi:hypothetical protein